MLVEEGDVLAGKYTVERVLGRGGMAYVLSAIHGQLQERVAIKLLIPELSMEREHLARFLQEARAAVKLRSEHVARVLDVGTHESGAPYIVMEYLEGHDLEAELERACPLPIPDAIDYVLQACDPIAEAHSLGIVHRDLKPANLFLTRRADGSPLIKVLDFGISKAIFTVDGAPSPSLTATQSLLGSPYYMSPEQVRRPKSVDHRTDIWSLGIILYELLTGKLPFMADTPMSVLAEVVSDPAPPLRPLRSDLPEELELVVLRCLEKDPAARFPDVAELARALEPFAPPQALVLARRLAGRTRTGQPKSDETIRSAVLRPSAAARSQPSNDSNHARRSAERGPDSASAPASSHAGRSRTQRIAIQRRLMLAGLLVAGTAGAVVFANRSEPRAPSPEAISPSQPNTPVAAPARSASMTAPAARVAPELSAALTAPSGPEGNDAAAAASAPKPEITPPRRRRTPTRRPATPNAATATPSPLEIDPLEGRR